MLGDIYRGYVSNWKEARTECKHSYDLAPGQMFKEGQTKQSFCPPSPPPGFYQMDLEPGKTAVWLDCNLPRAIPKMLLQPPPSLSRVCVFLALCKRAVCLPNYLSLCVLVSEFRGPNKK